MKDSGSCELHLGETAGPASFSFYFEFRSIKELKNVNRFLTLAASTALAISTAKVCLGQHYTQTNLDSNVSGAAEITDSQLVNGWGLARSSGGAWWVSDQGTGLSVTAWVEGGAAPCATATLGFHPAMVPSTVEKINAAGRSASRRKSFLLPLKITVVKTSDGSSYTGLTTASINGKVYLYAANFAAGRVDVYDSCFHSVKLREEDPDRRIYEDDRFECRNKPFTDERLPYGYVPFNVQAIGNDIVVTYALHEAGSLRETDGPGLGYVDIYSATGHLLRRLEHGDWLNARWGVTLAPLDFAE
jgi:hypothetical protein